ncbi:MAG: flagellar biosynthetic protein FliR [Armatimonadota bacterium]|nr:flagellar biosynthetic protein FliR [Armatimonadota bacterium]
MTGVVAELLGEAARLLPPALRVVGLTVLAPGLNFQQAPMRVRVALALGLGAVLAPVAAAGTPAVEEPLRYAGLCLVELAVGMAMGFAMAALLEALRFGGEVLDLQIGLRAGQLFDPSTGSQSGILSTAYYMVALLLFVAVDGHHWVLRGLGASFAIVPVGRAVVTPGLAALVGDLGTSLLVLGLQVAAPVMAALLLADLALGLVARAVPQINVFLVGIPGKIALGLVIAALTAPLLVPHLGRIARLMAVYLDDMLRVLAG